MNILSPSRFPHPNRSDENGIVATGGDLSVESLTDAYAHGIFPWPHRGLPLLWFSPLERGLVVFSELHVPRSLNKWLKKTHFKMTFDKAFAQVIQNCATQKRPGQNDTWVTHEMICAYNELHRRGFAHSVECWNKDKLVGGLYGVFVSGVFSAESMYFLETGASKLCLLGLIHRLQQKGHTWLDTQMITSFVETVGGRYIPRQDYLYKLERQQQMQLPF